jgi:hypothetical protein
VLPDLALTATLNGEPQEFLARDLPTAVFFLGFQDSFPGAECFSRMPAGEQRQVLTGMEAWSDALLCRIMIEPRLTPELVQRLGTARDELVLSYLGGIGWMEPPADLIPAAPVPRRGGPRLWPEDRAAVLAVPPPNIKAAIREIAAKSRTAPYEVWCRWAISEFVWTWRVVLQDDLKKRAGRSGMVSDLVERVGREAS